MESIDSLVPLIYHERQQEGSMLCAQHALNSLLQGQYFTAPDLSAIAHNLDNLEDDYDEDHRAQESMNMDDTGFFSVQVLEKALQVWGLNLVRWRSERMRPYQDHPHTQMAFILNSNQHWYTLRRFGRVSPDPSLDADPGNGHWFNLNSSNRKPERVGKLYLGMVLHQAETEGYSVFAVVQADPNAPLALSRVEADELAASIPEDAPTSSSAKETVEGLEDEDYDLQAALQASLMGASTSRPTPSQPTGPSRSFTLPFTSSSSRSRNSAQTPPRQVIRPRSPLVEMDDDDEEDEEGEMFHTPPTEYVPPPQPPAPRRSATAIDPVEASRLRSQAFMDHVLRQQQAAFREQYEREAARIQSGVPSRASTRQREEDDELARAIEESRALAESLNQRQAQQGYGQPPRGETRNQIIDVDADEDLNLDDEFPEIEPPVIPPHPSTFDYDYEHHRVYDDDDAELQAALKASLETVPEGFRIPSTPPRPQPPPIPAVPNPFGDEGSTSYNSYNNSTNGTGTARAASLTPPRTSAYSRTTPPATATPSNATTKQGIRRSESVDTDAEYQSEADSSVVDDEPVVSVEEMRRRRLAKFGG